MEKKEIKPRKKRTNISLDLNDIIDARIEKIIQDKFNSVIEDSKEKIKQMTFNYTANLDDTKSDYLKKYVESRLDYMQLELRNIPLKLENMQNDILKLEDSLGREVHDY